MKKDQLTAQELSFAELGKLSAGLMHDIRSPLNYLLNLSEMSLELVSEWEGNQSEGASIQVDSTELALLQKNLFLIRKHASLASRLIRISYNTLGGIPEHKTRFNLAEVVKDWASVVIASWKGNHPDFSISVNYKIMPGLPEFSGQEGIIAQVLMNLLQNAMHSMYVRAGQDYTFSPELSIELTAEEDQFLLRITDNGTGISEISLSEIFNPGFTTKTAEEGTGMGLYFSREAIRTKMGGDIKVESRVNEFTQLSVNLPIG